MPQQQDPEPVLQHGVSLAPLTTFGIGGPARQFYRATERIALAQVLARSLGQPLLVIGGGSNLLISDRGFPGLVIQIALCGLSWEKRDDGIELRAEAGESWDAVVAECVSRGFAGIECLSGIPGSVGAAPIQNIGAYGQEAGDAIVAVETLDLETGAEVIFRRAECEFGYRSSRFKRADAGRYIVLAVRLRLADHGTPAVRYPELARELRERGVTCLTPQVVRDAVLALRRRKAMLVDSSDIDSRSAGSFFLNPLLDRATCGELKARAEARGLGPPPCFETRDGRFKVSAAWLIEQAGFHKGYARGAAALSRRHALALVNRGAAAALDVVGLAREVRAGVLASFGVLLEPEVRLVGLSLEGEAA
jgi:UDP-N-acetylmuramate dehydrogenase